MSRNVLIIGGSYFAGKVFAEVLLEEGNNTICMVNRGNRPIQRKGVTEIVCDRLDDRLKKVIPARSWDAVVDFCAYTPIDVMSLMSAISEMCVNRYIFISTVSVYENTLDLPITENSATLRSPQPEFGPASDYGYNKRRAEIKVADLCGRAGIAYTILRPAIIFGEHNYAPRESYFFDLISKEKAVILPQNDLALYQFVSVRDVAKSILLSMDSPAARNRVFNLAGEELVSYRRLVGIIGEIAGKKVSTYALTKEEIDARQIPLPFPLDQHLIYSGSLIRRILGLEYAPFIDEMKRTWEWYKQTKGGTP